MLHGTYGTGTIMDEYAYLKRLADDKTFGKIVAGSFSRISPRPMWMAGHDDVDFIRYLMNGDPDKANACRSILGLFNEFSVCANLSGEV